MLIQIMSWKGQILTMDHFIIYDNELLPEENNLRTRFIYQSLGKAWCDFKGELFKLYEKYATDNEALKNCPSYVTKPDWGFLIKKYWKSDYFQAASARNKISRSKQSMLHCTERTRFSVVEHEDATKNNGITPSRVRMFELTRTRKDNKLVDVVAEEKMAQIKELVSQREEGTFDISDEEICLRIFGPDRSCHIRMRGSSVGGPLLHKNPTHIKEIEKYKKQAEDARVRLEQAEKIAHDARVRAEEANENADKAHKCIKNLYAILRYRKDTDWMDADEVLEHNENTGI